MVYVGMERFFCCHRAMRYNRLREEQREGRKWRGAGAGALRDHVVATQFGERTRREEGATTAGAEPVHVLQSWDATPPNWGYRCK